MRAALQFMRKMSEYRKLSNVNEGAFERAIEKVAEATRKLVDNLPNSIKPDKRILLANE